MQYRILFLPWTELGTKNIQDEKLKWIDSFCNGILIQINLTVYPQSKIVTLFKWDRYYGR
jgi:hypothetical protein